MLTYFAYSKSIWIARGRLGSLEPFPHSWQAEKSIYANNNGTGHLIEVALVWAPPKVEEVRWKH